jgi:phosphoglycolate phosphatase
MTQASASPQLILFDIDGTLLWPRGVGRDATHGAMLEVFGTCGNLEAHRFGGKTDWTTLVELLGDDGYTEESIGRWMPRYEKAAAHHTQKIIGDYPVEACPGAIELVHYIHKHAQLMQGIVTGNVSTTSPLKLQAAGFNPDWFPIGAYGSEALDRNDLPQMALERAITHFNQPITPQQVVVIGDTPADIACARALGAVAIAVKTGFATDEALHTAEPDHFLNDLTELYPLLQD